MGKARRENRITDEAEWLEQLARFRKGGEVASDALLQQERSLAEG